MTQLLGHNEETPKPEDMGKQDQTAWPDPEVPEQAKRRRFSARYKLRILKEADACAERGQLGALLRREGLYYSHLTTWKRHCQEGSLQSLSPKKRGPKPKTSKKKTQVAQLESENRRLRQKLNQAEAIIDIQKKVYALLEANQDSADESDEKS